MGPVGPWGLSAYEIAVIDGFKGDYVNWLESLQGAQGEEGANGKDGVVKTVIVKADGTTEVAPSLPQTGGYGKETAAWLAGSAAFLVLAGVGAVAVGRHRKQ